MQETIYQVICNQPLIEDECHFPADSSSWFENYNFASPPEDKNIFPMQRLWHYCYQSVALYLNEDNKFSGILKVHCSLNIMNDFVTEFDVGREKNYFQIAKPVWKFLSLTDRIWPVTFAISSPQEDWTHYPFGLSGRLVVTLQLKGL